MYMKKIVPDPIDSLTDVERAYIAGLLDGEGSLYIQSLGRRQGKESLHPSLRISMTHKGVISWLAEKFGVSRLYTLPPRNVDRFINGKRPQYTVSLFGKRAQRLARVTLPYLIVKSEQARIIIEFPILAQGKRVDIETRQARINLRERMIDANGRRNRNLHIQIPDPRLE